MAIPRPDSITVVNRFPNPNWEGPFVPDGGTITDAWPDGGKSLMVAASSSLERSNIGHKSRYVGLTPLEKMFDTPGSTWAHRGGSANWPEMSKYAYDQSIQQGYGALEVSMSRSSDGVWFGLHDTYLDRTSGITGNIDPRTMTWAQIQEYNIVIGASGAPQPYMSWDQLVVDLPKNMILILDPKSLAGNIPANNELIQMGREWGVEKTIFKFFGVGSGATNFANRCTDAGFETWGYFYESDIDNGSLERDEWAWTTLGLTYTAPQSYWDILKGYNKPTVAHIVPNQAGWQMSMDKGADMVQCSGVLEIDAVESWL